MEMTVTETQLEAAFDAWYRASVAVPVAFDSGCPVDGVWQARGGASGRLAARDRAREE